jgi:hypothetical protein
MNASNRRRFVVATLAAAAQAACGGGGGSAAPANPATRSFRLGVTRWPPELTLAGIAAVDAFVAANCDFVAPMLLGGVPWTEALSGAAFSTGVQNDLAYRPPAGKKMLVSIGALDDARARLAPYRGASDNQALPAPFDALPFDAPEVKTAFASFALRVVDAMQPDYLAIGIEANVLLTQTPAAWPAYLALHRATYQAVKARHPALPVCFTIEALHFRGWATGSDPVAQRREVLALLATSDLVAWSVYPHMSFAIPRPLPDGFFDFLGELGRAAGGKPVAVSESGYTSRNVQVFALTLQGTPQDQERHVNLLLDAARRDRFAFVVNFAGIDFERLTAQLTGDAQQIANIWTYTGLQASDGSAKPALARWREHLAIPAS